MGGLTRSWELRYWGVDGGKVMSMLQITMMGKLPYTSLRDGVFALSLLAKSLNNLFGALDG